MRGDIGVVGYGGHVTSWSLETLKSVQNETIFSRAGQNETLLDRNR